MKTFFLSIGHNLGRNYVKGTLGWVKSKYPDKGATGNGTTEFAEAKKIVDELMKLQIPGIHFVKVPEGLNLDERIAWINSQIGKYPEPFALEFHLDAGVSSARGASVWYDNDNTYTLREGKQFLQKYTEITGMPSRHVNSDKTNRHGDLGFVSKVKTASLLIELGFITNQYDMVILRNNGFQGVLGGIRAMVAS